MGTETSCPGFVYSAIEKACNVPTVSYSVCTMIWFLFINRTSVMSYLHHSISLKANTQMNTTAACC